LAPLPDAGRVLRGAGVPDRAGALRGAAVRRVADGAAGRPTRFAAALDAGVRVALLAVLLAVARCAAPVRPVFAAPFDAAGDAPFDPAPRPAVGPPAVEPLASDPFADDPGDFFGAALPVPRGAPLAPDAPAPDPVREVDDGRAPEARAGPEGRVGRREEGMGRLCRFAGPLYRHYLRRAVCRTCGTQKPAPAPAIRPVTLGGYGPNDWVGAGPAGGQPWKRGNADRPA